MAISLRRSRTAEQQVLGKDQQEYLRGCSTFEDGRCDGYRTFEDFYNGRRQPQLNDRQRQYLQQAAGGIVFTENVCQTVIDKLAQRLHVEAFQVQANDDASDWLSTTVFPHNGGDELQGVVHTNTAMLGDYTLICDWDDDAGLPRWRANHPRLVRLVYDEDAGNLADPAYAVKKWSTQKRTDLNPTGIAIWRMNVYHPDRVEKYFSVDKDGENWAVWRDDPSEPWPLPWTLDGLPDGEPLGVPVVHFRNKPLGSPYGRSELRAAIPFQLEHTKNILDHFDVMDAYAWGWVWATGVSEAETVKLAIGDVLTLPNEAARVGQIPAANPQATLEPIKGTLQRLATFTDTPLQSLLADATVSGEARKVYGEGAVKKAEDRQATLGNAWQRSARLSLRLAAAHGELPFDVDPEAQITTVWDSAETRDEALEATNAILYSELGVSHRTLMRRLGFDPDEEATQKALEEPAPVPPPLPGFAQ